MSRSVPVSSIETSSLQENLAVSEVSSTLGSTLMDTALVAHTWHIHNFSTHQELLASGDALESLRFGTSDGQHEFYMKLFPQGKDDECAGFISLFLYIQKCPQPRLRFRVNFVIETADGPRGCALNRNVVTINRGGIVTASKFFSVEMLKVGSIHRCNVAQARHERFVPDDTLTVGVQLTIFGDAHCEKLLTADEEDLDETTSAFLSPSHSSSLNALSPAARVRKVAVSATPQRSPLNKNVASSDSAFGCLLNNDTFSDFRIEVGVGSDKREFSVHRALITPRSGFFSALFHNNQNKEVIEGKAKFDDVSSKTMLSLLTYLYTGSCPNIEDNTIDLLFVADRFCVDGLKKECEEELMRGLRVDNAALRIQVADRVGASRLLNKAKRFFVANREVIMKTEDWEELKKDQPALAVRVLEDCWLLSDRSSKRIKLS